MNRTLTIIPCGRAKIWDRHPSAGPTVARRAYVGSPFKVAKAYAEANGEWMILSAKYGFVNPGFVISGPYNVTFNKKSTNPITVFELQAQAKQQGLLEYDRIIVLGGKEYRRMAQQVFSFDQLELPFAGLRIGLALRAIKSATSSR